MGVLSQTSRPPHRRASVAEGASEVHALASDDGLARGHEDGAVVARRMDGLIAIGGDQFALGKGFKAHQRAGEAEVRAAHHMGFEQFEATWRLAGLGQPCPERGAFLSGCPGRRRSPGRDVL